MVVMERKIQAPSEMKRASERASRWYIRPTEALAEELQTDLNVGLNVDESVRRRTQEGPNELPEARPSSLLKLFIAQFSSLLV